VTPEQRRAAWARTQAVEPEGAPEAPSDELAAVEKERDEYIAALQRLKAEFDNYRKRVAREEQQLVARAGERIMKQLLPMADDLDRAVTAAGEHGDAQVAEGVRLVHRSLVDLLAREGVVEVDTGGQFDPHTQEALLTQTSDEPEGTVIQVIQPGYKLGDHVLRPARVVISSGPPTPAEG
jgi:molecular chaperone GrpE